MYTEREGWLVAAAVLLQAEVFPAAGVEPAAWEQRRYRVSCGFPIGYRGSRTGKIALGQAFDPSISADGTMEVFINPILDDRIAVLAVLAHELGHVWAGIAAGHRGEFARFHRAVGLIGPATTAVPGPELTAKLTAIADTLGAYPHARVDPNARKKQGTRLLKLSCAPCGWVARVSGQQGRRLTDKAACPCCGTVGSLTLED